VLHAGGIDGVAGGEVVAAVQHDIGLRNQVVQQAIIGAVRHRRDAHIGVDRGMASRADWALGSPTRAIVCAIWRCRLVASTCRRGRRT
jgi:hypothetical protein